MAPAGGLSSLNALHVLVAATILAAAGSAAAAPTAVSVDGDASADYLAVSGTGDARANVLCVGVPLGGRACLLGGVAASGTGDSRSCDLVECVAVAGTGSARATNAVAVFGYAHAICSFYPCVAASLAGEAVAECSDFYPCVAVSVFGRASGGVEVSLCEALEAEGHSEACLGPA